MKMMGVDFTLKMYSELLKVIKDRGYTICTFSDFSIYSKLPEFSKKLVCLRHDVDRMPINALKMAELENKFGIQSTYYFRYIKNTFKKDIILQIASYGHEIGYHYETLAKAKGDINLAKKLFKEELENFRRILPIHTACMHGSPLSKYDNRDIWNHSTLEDYNILAEPYFSIDYNEVEYYTDTGRQWGATKTNIRDRVKNHLVKQKLKSTYELINYIKDAGPKKIIIQTHPERWGFSKSNFIKSFSIHRQFKIYFSLF
jgi:hypothetical protein